MENLTVNKADVIAKLNAIAPAVAEAVEAAKAFNKEAILKEVEYTVSNADGFTTSASTKKITVKTAGHLKNLPDQAKRIVNLYSLHAGDTVELDQYEAETLAALVNADLSLKEEEATFSAAVRRY